MAENEINNVNKEQETVYKVGDKYKQYSLGFFEYLSMNEDESGYDGKKYYECTIKFITPTNNLILEINDTIEYGDGTFDTSLFSGKEIKTIYQDFNGEDEKKYCVLYEENSPFY